MGCDAKLVGCNATHYAKQVRASEVVLFNPENRGNVVEQGVRETSYQHNSMPSKLAQVKTEEQSLPTRLFIYY
jgi:hypothetical protein